MANFFSSPWFLDAAARVYFPGAGTRVGTVEVQGQLYDVLLRRDGRPAPIPLMDYLDPRDPDEGRPAEVRRVPSLGAVVRELVPVPGPDLDPGPYIPAPRVHWREFPTWEAFTRRCGRRSRNAFKRHEKKMAALGAEIGPTRLSLDEPDHRLLEEALMWKSRQLRMTGRPDRFASLRNRQLLHLLLDGGQLKLAVLFAGDRALAMEIGHNDGRAHAAWITSYNVEFSRYSPGILLFERIMQASWEAGHEAFDFLAGGDTYKFNYATHAWLVGPIGQPPLHERARARARTWITDHSDTSGARMVAFQAARWVLERRLDREALAEVARDAAWVPDLQRDQESWPQGRLADPTACQLRSLLAWGARDASPMATGLARAEGIARGFGHTLLAQADGTPAAEGRGRQSLSVGEHVRVRAPAEIAATLSGGQTDGVRHLKPVMDRLAGRTFQVFRVVGRFYDESSQRVIQARHTVILSGACCDGTPVGHRGGCDRACPLLWAEGWLERVEPPAPTAAPSTQPGPSRPPFRVGDHVRVRTLEEIAEAGGSDGVHFVPALMGAFSGRLFRVGGLARQAYDERRRAVFPLGGPLLLEGVQCPGAPLVGGGRCDRSCALLWREAWLEGVSEGARLPT